MKHIILFFLLAVPCAAFQDAPTKKPELTDKQKVEVREAQLNVSTIEAEKFALESRLKDLTAALPLAKQKLGEVLKSVAPSGYSVMSDLSLSKNPEPTPVPAK